ncbi:MAG: hypothetical protein C4547_03320 [Phycisphaerales bacterium]|nr:MAG: hypothetical protein C4547_03320 [Phycisphaerales bacterium]
MSEFLNAIQTFLQQSVSQATLEQAPKVAVVALIVGVLLSVLGAKLARSALTLAGVVVGGYVGLNILAHDTDFPRALCVLLPAAIVGGIAYQSYRLWSGALAATLITALAMGTFSYQRVLPYVAELQAAAAEAAASVPPPGQLELPTADQLHAAPASAAETLRGYWTRASEADPRLVPHARSLATAAALMGLLVGMIFLRASMILCTSFLGTVLLGSGMTEIIRAFSPGFYQSLVDYPNVGATAMGACFVISLIMQARLTRPSRSGSVAEPATA